MRSNFKISKQHNDDSIHLRLFGDFNDISICELLDVLKDDCAETTKVFIHTDSLERVSVSGFGRDVFQRNLHNLSDDSFHIQFASTEDSRGSCENWLFQ